MPTRIGTAREKRKRLPSIVPRRSRTRLRVPGCSVFAGRLSYKTRHDDRTRRRSPRRTHLRSYERQEIPVRTRHISASWPPVSPSPPVHPTFLGITGVTNPLPPAYSASRPPIIADTRPTGYDSKPIAYAGSVQCLVSEALRPVHFSANEPPPAGALRIQASALSAGISARASLPKSRGNTVGPDASPYSSHSSRRVSSSSTVLRIPKATL